MLLIQAGGRGGCHSNVPLWYYYYGTRIIQNTVQRSVRTPSRYGWQPSSEPNSKPYMTIIIKNNDSNNNNNNVNSSDDCYSNTNSKERMRKTKEEDTIKGNDKGNYPTIVVQSRQTRIVARAQLDLLFQKKTPNRPRCTETA
ncbi:hypothetical protein LZ32DRAFT_310166 [Colletotrichum eremochloae]|nr:hypothetical protein LZ32DRAFT_310166 [Colletotrichum eremochloae]